MFGPPASVALRPKSVSPVMLCIVSGFSRWLYEPSPTSLHLQKGACSAHCMNGAFRNLKTTAMMVNRATRATD